MGGCPEGIIHHELYRVLQPPCVAAQKKLFSTGYTWCFGLYSAHIFLAAGNRSRGVSGGEITGEVSGGKGDVPGGGFCSQVGLYSVCVCVKRQMRLNQASVVFSGSNAFAVTASMTTVMVFVVTTWFLV